MIAPGQRLGPFELEEELGSGGMGTVYRAAVVESVLDLAPGEPVAVKVFHDRLAGEASFLERFRQEAELGARVLHPNVVRTHGHCMADDQHVLALEFVDGRTLRDLLQDMRRVPEALCVHIGHDVAAGLAAIHAEGAVHRDLKPENVLITPDHEVKITDLGVALLTDATLRLSRTGAFVGSVHYAAPEQFSDADLDARADLHALGVLLLELASGRHPFAGTEFPAVMRAVLEEVPERLGKHFPQISPCFEEVVRTLVEKDPGHRFQSAATVCEVLRGGEDSTWWQGRAKELRRATGRALRRIKVPRETALFGRDEELAALDAAYRAAAAGEGRVLLIEGEAGIGKSRLVDSLIENLEETGEDVDVIVGGYPPGGAATAWGAYAAGFRAFFGDGTLAEAVEQHLNLNAEFVAAFAALLRGETVPGTTLDRDALQTAFLRLLQSIAVERPVILVIDDLHFSPDAGRSLFASLAHGLVGHRVLLVGTARPGLTEQWLGSVERLDHARRIALSRLGARDLARLLEDAFQSPRLAQHLGHKVATKSDGNPFFVFEILRELREAAFISRTEDGSWVSTREIEQIRIPSSIQELIGARLQDLDPEDRDLLEVAACCGYEFDPGLAGGALGIARIPLLQRLGRIERRHGLVRASGRRFVFDHHQVQEALYEGLSDLLREEYHAALADVLEESALRGVGSHDDIPAREAIELCQHFLRGGRPEGARPYLFRVLDLLATTARPETAIDLCDRALVAFSAAEERVRLLLAKGTFVDRLARTEERIALVEQALALVGQVPDNPELRARVLSDWGWASHLQRREADAERALRDAIRIADEAGSAVEVMRGQGSLGSVLSSMRRFEEARAAFEVELRVGREEDHTGGELHAMSGLAKLHVERGDFGEAIALLERRIEIGHQRGDRRSLFQGHYGLSDAFYNQGKLRDAREHAVLALAIAREFGERRREAWALDRIAKLSIAMGDVDDAERLVERFEAIACEQGDMVARCGALGSLGSLRRREGRFDEARDAYTAQLELAREHDLSSSHYGAAVSLAGICEDKGDFGEALVHNAEAIHLAREDDILVDVALHNRGLLLWRCGSPDAGAALEESLEITERVGKNALSARNRMFLARVAEDHGDMDEAERQYAAALAQLDADEHPVIHVYLREFFASYRARQGDAETARSVFEDIAANFPAERDWYAHFIARVELALLNDDEGFALADEWDAYPEEKERYDIVEAGYLLWKLTGRRDQLDSARSALLQLAASLPEDLRERMLTDVPLHRAVMAASASSFD